MKLNVLKTETVLTVKSLAFKTNKERLTG